MENTLTKIQPNRFILVKKLLKMIQALLAIEPILINLVAIVLAMGILILLNYPTLFPKLGKYHQYLTYIIYALILIQTMKSATKSLFIPILAIVIAGLGMALLSFNPAWQFISLDVLKKMMLLGAIGVSISIFVMQ